MQRSPVLCFMAPQLFIERTCPEEPAKGNKQQWDVITGLKDVFPASSEPSCRTQPSASLSHPDCIMYNLGLRRGLESIRKKIKNKKPSDSTEGIYKYINLIVLRICTTVYRHILCF